MSQDPQPLGALQVGSDCLFCPLVFQTEELNKQVDGTTPGTMDGDGLTMATTAIMATVGPTMATTATMATACPTMAELTTARRVWQARATTAQLPMAARVARSTAALTPMPTERLAVAAPEPSERAPRVWQAAKAPV